MSLMIDGWMPSVGSSRISSLGAASPARGAIASCCCWPPDRSPPRRRSICLQHREQLEDALGTSRAALLRREAHLEVLFDGEPRKDLAPCGT